MSINKARRSKSLAKAAPAPDPNAHEYLTGAMPNSEPDVKGCALDGGKSRTEESSGKSIRFVGLLTLFLVAFAGLVVAIVQSSVQGIVWMTVTTAITGIAFYLALQEFSTARGTQHH